MSCSYSSNNSDLLFGTPRSSPTLTPTRVNCFSRGFPPAEGRLTGDSLEGSFCLLQSYTPNELAWGPWMSECNTNSWPRLEWKNPSCLSSHWLILISESLLALAYFGLFPLICPVSSGSYWSLDHFSFHPKLGHPSKSILQLPVGCCVPITLEVIFHFGVVSFRARYSLRLNPGWHPDLTMTWKPG